MRKNRRQDIHLPKSLTKEDKRNTLEKYIVSTNANPNNLHLLAQARSIPEAGIDDKIRLLAKQKYAEWNEAVFTRSEGALAFGINVTISDTQKEPLSILQDGRATHFSYSKDWLKEHFDDLSIITNFTHIFPIVDEYTLLTLPGN